MYIYEDYACWESHAAHEDQCVHVDLPLYEWHEYKFERTTNEGEVNIEAYVDGSSTGALSDQPSILRIYPEVDFIFGAETAGVTSGLSADYFFYGFQYSLRFGLEYGPGGGDSINFANGTPVCTCDSWDCPLTEGCLGVCNWNYFWDGDANKCVRCPYWCHEGCSTNGSC